MMKLLKLASLTALVAIGSGAVAQPYPTKPIRLLVPYAPGGTTDIMARALQEPMQKSLGQPLVIENKAGGAGSIAMREVARSAPDGYNIAFVNGGLVSTTPVLQKDAGYDGVKDFAPVGLVSVAPMFVVANGNVPVNDLKAFIDYARSNPGKVEYASAGPGSFGHLSSELFARAAGIKMVHVPYKGQAPTTNAVMTGEVKLLITTASATMNSHIASGKLKLLAVGSAEPSPLAPGTPTVSSVLPGYKAETWFALLAPAGTPSDVVTRLNDALGKALAQSDMQQRFTSFGMIAKSSTPEALRQLIIEDVKTWGSVIRETGIKVE
jgi:tripartite-type tricarboxylate transporter receptor subunit TctC